MSLDLSAHRFSREHQWILLGDDGIATLGITPYAAEQLGVVVFVEAPAPGTRIRRNTVIADVESVKVVGEVYTPVDGEVVERNEVVIEDPSLLNSSPFEKGWIVRIRLDGELPDDLLDAAGYEDYLGGK